MDQCLRLQHFPLVASTNPFDLDTLISDEEVRGSLGAERLQPRALGAGVPTWCRVGTWLCSGLSGWAALKGWESGPSGHAHRLYAPIRGSLGVLPPWPLVPDLAGMWVRTSVRIHKSPVSSQRGLRLSSSASLLPKRTRRPKVLEPQLLGEKLGRQCWARIQAPTAPFSCLDSGAEGSPCALAPGSGGTGQMF